MMAMTARELTARTYALVTEWAEYGEQYQPTELIPQLMYHTGEDREAVLDALWVLLDQHLLLFTPDQFIAPKPKRAPVEPAVA